MRPHASGPRWRRHSASVYRSLPPAPAARFGEGRSVLDLKFIRQNPDLVKAGAEKKRIACDIDHILELDVEKRSMGTRIDDLRQSQREAGKAIAQAVMGAETVT